MQIVSANEKAMLSSWGFGVLYRSKTTRQPYINKAKSVYRELILKGLSHDTLHVAHTLQDNVLLDSAFLKICKMSGRLDPWLTTEEVKQKTVVRTLADIFSRFIVESDWKEITS